MTEPTDPLDFSGRTVLVTGGTKGVGRGIAVRFLEAGAEVVVAARSEPDATVAAGDPTGRVRRRRPAATPAEAAAAVPAAVEAGGGRLDTVINNAGGAPPADAATASPRFSSPSSQSSSTCSPPCTCRRRPTPSCRAKLAAGPSSTSAASVGCDHRRARRPTAGGQAGCWASLAQTLAVEWAPKVRVNLITGGLILTEQAHLFYGDEAGIARVAATVPLGRLATPRDIGDACLFLASPMASYISAPTC